MVSLKNRINSLELEKEELLNEFKKLESNKKNLSEDDYESQKNRIERALVEIMDRLVQYRVIENSK